MPYAFGRPTLSSQHWLQLVSDQNISQAFYSVSLCTLLLQKGTIGVLTFPGLLTSYTTLYDVPHPKGRMVSLLLLKHMECRLAASAKFVAAQVSDLG